MLTPTEFNILKSMMSAGIAYETSYGDAWAGNNDDRTTPECKQSKKTATIYKKLQEKILKSRKGMVT